MKKQKRIMVDMSATIIHHGHIRLLKKAKKFGYLIVALASDKEILKNKKIKTPFTYKQRKEVLNSIKYVDEIVKSKWKITDEFLKKYNIDLLVHGNDNQNLVDKSKIKIFKRTRGINSALLSRCILIRVKPSSNGIIPPKPCNGSNINPATFPFVPNVNVFSNCSKLFGDI